jgi:hypothetical protein
VTDGQKILLFTTKSTEILQSGNFFLRPEKPVFLSMFSICYKWEQNNFLLLFAPSTASSQVKNIEIPKFLARWYPAISFSDQACMAAPAGIAGCSTPMAT